MEGGIENLQILDKQMAAFENIQICICVHSCNVMLRQLC